MSDLTTRFEDAVAQIQSAEGDYKPSNDMKLKMYGLFKQATEGDVGTKKPGAFDMVGRAKWNAWKEMQGLSAEQAMQAYVDQVEELSEHF